MKMGNFQPILLGILSLIFTKGRTLMRKYTFAEIARMLSRGNTGNFITEDRIKSWVNKGYLNAERVPDYVQSWGKYPYWIQESELKHFLRAKGYDVDSIFPCE